MLLFFVVLFLFQAVGMGLFDAIENLKLLFIAVGHGKVEAVN